MPPASPAPTSPKKSSRWGDLAIRFISAITIIVFEFLVLGAGHIAIFAEIFILQFVAVHELVRITEDESKRGLLSWYLRALPCFMTTLTSYLVTAPLLLRNFLDPSFFLLKYHHFICFCAGALIIVLFVINLTPENDSYAFTRFGWSLIACVVLIVPISCYVYVTYYSLFWFFICVCLIALNDTAAYFCGRMFGRHRLIKLSPNKTVEGFVGAVIFTVIAGWFLPLIFAKYPFTYCPGIKPYDFHVTCEVPEEFVMKDIPFFGNMIRCYPAQIHSLVLAVFASLIAPFGGFLGSGLKRAYNIKDFGNLIPGHGGIIDRVDCQFVMAGFAYLYISTFVRNNNFEF